jgi:hypothetical protein
MARVRRGVPVKPNPQSTGDFRSDDEAQSDRYYERVRVWMDRGKTEEQAERIARDELALMRAFSEDDEPEGDEL